jgi:hypothetical protein
MLGMFKGGQRRMEKHLLEMAHLGRNTKLLLLLLLLFHFALFNKLIYLSVLF